MCKLLQKLEIRIRVIRIKDIKVFPRDGKILVVQPTINMTIHWCRNLFDNGSTSCSGQMGLISRSGLWVGTFHPVPAWFSCRYSMQFRSLMWIPLFVSICLAEARLCIQGYKACPLCYYIKICNYLNQISCIGSDRYNPAAAANWIVTISPQNTSYLP